MKLSNVARLAGMVTAGAALAALGVVALAPI